MPGVFLAEHPKPASWWCYAATMALEDPFFINC